MRVWLTEVERVYESEEEHQQERKQRQKSENAAIVDILLKNGASLVGITHMDELAYPSMARPNTHGADESSCR